MFYATANYLVLPISGNIEWVKKSTQRSTSLHPLFKHLSIRESKMKLCSMHVLLGTVKKFTAGCRATF